MILSVKSMWKFLVSCCVVVALFFVLIPPFFTLLGFPSQLKIIQGIEQSLEINFPFDIYLECDEPEQLMINGAPMEENLMKINLADPFSVKSDTVGKVNVDFRLFGLIPIRQMEVDVIPEIKVYPAGHSIGVLLHSDGVMVIEHSWVDGADGKRYYPGREAGIDPGDYLMEISGKKMLSKEDVALAIDHYGESGKALKVKVKKQNGKIENLTLQPVKSDTGKYMVGLYIDDGVAGVGTMTFYEPQTGTYGALGHVITDSYTQKPINIRSGEIVNATISGINLGQRGLPGEKLGTFMDSSDELGIIKKNCDYGIYGILNHLPQNPYFKEPISVATSRQVETGSAWIYTVVEGGKIEKFAIEIEHVSHQNRPATKGLIIRVVDQRLLKLTGGIIQGMSGSPIVQNGRLVGGVTHVFVNDPQKGYGVLAEWMIKEAGLDLKVKQREIAK